MTHTTPTIYLQLHRLELLIEYQYQGTTPPAIAEVTSTELLMWLGYGIAISYLIYSKLKPRFYKRRNANQRTLLESSTDA